MENQGAPKIGPAPDGAAMLIIDMINDFDVVDSLIHAAADAADVIAGLRDQADELGLPIIYVNDNHGQWHSERAKIVEAFLRVDSPARGIVNRIRPRNRDLFVIKPQFSGFYATNLPVLLPRLGAHRLVLTGAAADMCVLFTAADAHMREYELWTPSDAVASESAERTNWALDIMKKAMGAETIATTDLSLADWVKGHGVATTSPRSS